jgi:thiamine-phosphate pyrophosphorylase
VIGKLAREAARLNARAKAPRALPALALMTDDERLPDPLSVARLLPRGSLVVLRTRDAARRGALAEALLRIAASRGIRVSIAGDPQLAARCGVDGVHFPEARIGEAMHWRTRRPNWLITCAAHSLSSCVSAFGAHADAVFLSPVFATLSHPGSDCLGPLRALAIARASPLPVYALGGINAQNAARLGEGGFVGVAAIGGLTRGGSR